MNKKPVIINCANCGKERIIKPYLLGIARYCSLVCYGKSNIGKQGGHYGRKHSPETIAKLTTTPKEKRNCQTCEKEFLCYPIATNKFCGKECYWIYLKGKEPKNKGRKLPSLAGKNNPNWKNGKWEHSMGYYSMRHDGKSRLEHRVIMEQYLGRNLEENEVIHHINKDKKDNRIENLLLLDSQSEHMKIHLKERWANK